MMIRRMMSTSAKRGLGTAASSLPKRESTFVRVWVNTPAAWPIFAITIGALTFSAYKIYHDLTGPDYHFNREHRRTIDYVENARDPQVAVAWGETAFHKGPQFIRERLIKRE